MVAVRFVIDKKKKEKLLNQIKELEIFKNVKNEKIDTYRDKNTLIWEFDIDKNILTNDFLSIFSNNWYIILDKMNIGSAISEDKIKYDGLKWINFELS